MLFPSAQVPFYMMSLCQCGGQIAVGLQLPTPCTDYPPSFLLPGSASSVSRAVEEPLPQGPFAASSSYKKWDPLSLPSGPPTVEPSLSPGRTVPGPGPPHSAPLEAALRRGLLPWELCLGVYFESILLV